MIKTKLIVLQTEFKWSRTKMTPNAYKHYDDDETVAVNNGSWNSIMSTGSIKSGKWLVELKVCVYQNKPAITYWNSGNSLAYQI